MIPIEYALRKKAAVKPKFNESTFQVSSDLQLYSPDGDAVRFCAKVTEKVDCDFLDKSEAFLMIKV